MVKNRDNTTMDYDINAYSSDEEPRRPKIIRRRPNFFEEFDEDDFFYRFRLSKRSVEIVLEIIRDDIKYPTNRNDCMTPENQLLLTLSYYSNGSFLRVSGDFCGVSKSTASKTIKRVTLAIASQRPHFINMTPDYAQEARQRFYQIARFPRCIGVIDCTHVKIQSPGGNNAELFRNRKGFFSINVQTVVDANLKIRDIVARWPGSTHDANIFRNSSVYHRLENGDFGDGILLGDSGYPLRPYLITPLLQTRTEGERLFNESLIRTRNTVERAYGIWKRRFPALAMGIRLDMDVTLPAIVATGILHNIACDQRDLVPPVNNIENEAIVLINNINNEVLPPAGELNNITRVNLINNYFSRL